MLSPTTVNERLNPIASAPTPTKATAGAQGADGLGAMLARKLQAAAAFVLTLAALLGATLDARAEVLISNAGQTGTGTFMNVGVVGVAQYSKAMGFTTGGYVNGYPMTSVEILTRNITGSDEARISIFAANSSGNPGNSLFVLNNPTTFTNDQFATFTAPAGTVLVKDTKYFVVIEGPVGEYTIGATFSNELDAGQAPGWSLDTARFDRTSDTQSWSLLTSSYAKPRMTINGTIPPPSTDATLSALTVHDGTSDRTLAPPFAPSTFAYTTQVARTATALALTATTSDGAASISTVTLNATPIADTDFTDGITIPSLAAGDNAIAVTVTAEDASSTETYTVTTTRLNHAPEFETGTNNHNVLETTPTNTDFGDRHTASDADNDELEYTIRGGNTAEFRIDATTGQLRTFARLDYELRLKYLFELYVHDGYGGGDKKDIIVWAVDEDEPPGTPDAPVVTATEGTTTSLDVSWVEPDLAGGPEIIGYNLQYRALGETEWTDGPQRVGRLTKSVPNLMENTFYEVRVQAVNDELPSGWSETERGSTNAVPATVTDIAFTNTPTDGVYNLGEIIEVSVTFSHAVEVTGNPRIGLYLLFSTDYATYVASASQGTVLVFRYTVTGARDDDINGIHVNENGLELNGGTIRTESSTVDANLAHSSSPTGLPTRTRLVEDIAVTSTQRVPTAGTGRNPTYGPGEIIEFTITFGDTVNVAGAPIFMIPTAGDTLEAAYTNGTGSNALQFEWTVPASLQNEITLRVRTNIIGNGLETDAGLVLNGATLTDSGARPVNIRHGQMELLTDLDATAPVLLGYDYGVIVKRARLELIYKTAANSTTSDSLDDTSPPGGGDFLVEADGARVFVASTQITDKETVRITLSREIQFGEVVTIDYTPGTSRIKDLWGNEAIAVTDRAVRNDTPASTNATLSTLTAHDGANDVSLAPPFVSGTFAYTADVPSTIAAITLTATPSNDNTSISAVTVNGVAIADTDLNDGIDVPSLIEGDNVIAITATAQSGDTETYTVTVTRAVAAATVTDIAFTNLPSDNVYDLGEIMEVSVTFSEAVEVIGAPKIVVRLYGTNEDIAYQASESTATVLVFHYTVTGAVENTPKPVISPNSIDLNGGEIINLGTTVNANLTHGVLDGLATDTRLVEDIEVTSTQRVPEADSGSVPTYGPGEVVEFTVSFGDTINVSGMPILKVSTAEAGFDAEYTGGTGSEVLRFEWTIPANLPYDTIVRISSNIQGSRLHLDRGLTANAATLTDSGSRPVNVRHVEKNFLIYADASPPVLSSYSDGATVDATQLKLIYRVSALSQDNDWLDESLAPAPGDFTVIVDATEVAVDTVEITDEETVRLTLTQAVRSGDLVTIDYTPGTSRIQDLWGNEAIAVTNREVSNETAAAMDAMLSALTAHDGANDLSLAPPFASATFAYTAEVPSTIAAITLTATPSDDRASISAVTLNDSAIADTDLNDGIDVPALIEGDNVIAVTARAENGDTQTYTVTVTRLAAPATVTDVAFTNLPQDGFYDLGEIIEVSVTFSEAVEVIGVPRMLVELFVLDDYATYQTSESTDTVLVFHYIVTGSIDDTQYSYISPNAIDLNGGTILNLGTTVDAELAHGLVEGLPTRTRLVEDIAVISTPRVPSEESGNRQTYGPGELMELTVTFADTVNVNGMPILKITTPRERFDAEYTGGTGSETLGFEWTIPASLPERTLIQIVSNFQDGRLQIDRGLIANGATLTDSGDRAVNIRHLTKTFVIYIDATPPVLLSDDNGATVDGADLKLIYRDGAHSADPDWLDRGLPPASGDFTVTVGTTEVSVDTVEITDEETVRLTLAQAVHSGDIVTIDYTPGATPIRDLWGNEAIAVDNRAVRNDTAASTDATLSALTAHDGSNDLILAPAFASATLAYTADVPNTITAITLTATPSDDDTLISAVTLNGSAIADTNLNDTIDVPSLVEGDNVIAVTATARNGDTQTYTVTVTRATTQATVANLALTNRPSDNIYDLGEIIEVSVTFSEAVEVMGMPSVIVELFGQDGDAVYQPSQSTTTVLVFQYIVTGRIDNTQHGSVPPNAIKLNGGKIVNLGTTVNADLAHGFLSGITTRTRLVEDIAITSTQRVPSAQSGGVPTYGPGEVIELTVSFADTVDVSGGPILKITTRDGKFDAHYSAGTGSEALRFEWTIPASLPKRSEVRISSNIHGSAVYLDRGLVANGATLTDSANRPVNVRHVLTELRAYVDAAPPVLYSADTGATVDGTKLKLIYRTTASSADPDWLDDDLSPASGDFTVIVGGAEISVDSVEITNEETVRLTLSQAVHSSDTVTIDYTPGTNPIKDLWGNEAVAVSNRAVRNDTAAGANDATLSALTAHDGTDELILDSPFASGTFAYTTGVANTITSITLTATPSDGNTEVTAVTLNGAPVSDLDFTDGIAVPSLVEGENVIVVTTTAQNGATETYTITVERATAEGEWGELRLVNEADPSDTGAGRLEVFYRKKWGTVCDDRFASKTFTLYGPDNTSDADDEIVPNVAPQLACQLMGYDTGAVVSRGHLGMSVAPSTQKIWLDDVRCAEGSATKGLHQCYHAGLGLENCSHAEDIHLRCVASDDTPGALTAEFQQVPESHTGDEFRFRIKFSEPVDLEGQELVDGPLVVTGAESLLAANIDDRADLWQVTVRPTVAQDVSIALESGHACDHPRAVCTGDGRTLSEGVSASVEGKPLLTASVSTTPASHDGVETTVIVEFSEELAPGFALPVAPGVLEAVNARIDTIEQSGTNARRYSISVTPIDPGKAVHLRWKRQHACDLDGAICTLDGRRLSHSLSATVPAGTSMAVVATPLTARFANVPDEHDGEHKFTLEIVFSEAPAGMKNKTLRNALRVTNGAVTRVRRVNQVLAHRIVTVRPTGHQAVDIELPTSQDCDAAAAICTAAGGRLETGLLTRVRGPAALRVADAEVHEGPGAVLAFSVTLDRATSAAVSVDYATSDGTAQAGSDYTAASGSVAFAPGERAKTVNVAVLDDSHDEGSETLTLTLSNPSGAYLADAVATGTIKNTDAMPRAWMVRFGRTIGTQVVDTLTQRLDGASGSHVTVAGINVMGAPRLEPLAEDNDPFGLPEWAKNAERKTDAQTITADDLLLRSAFHISSGSGGPGGGPAFTAWGRVATGGFEAEEDGVTMDGDVTTGLVGFDAEWEQALAGVMLSQSTGDGAYRQDTAKGDDAGTVESSLTGVYPYVQVDLNAKISAWALAGMGSGDLTLRRTGKNAMPTDISMRMGAAGVKGQVLDGSGPSGVALNVKSDAMWVSTKSADTSDLAPTRGDVTRLRLIIQGERTFESGSGAAFTPSAEVGLRHDGGDAETGTGVEVGAGLRYSAGAVTIEAKARTLVAHEDNDYEEWGMSGAIRVTPHASGRGITLSIAPVWGRAESAAERLWGAPDAQALGANNEFEARGRLEMDAGYGFGLPSNRGVLTPYAGLTLGDAGHHAIRTGARWQLGPDATLALEASQKASGADKTDSEVMVRIAVRF